MDFIQNILFFIGRLLIAGFFLFAAVEKIRHWDSVMSHLKQKKIPQLPIMLPLAVVLQILGGISILIGFHPHIGALFLILTILPSFIYLHPFWQHAGVERTKELQCFMKNVAILGALLVLLALGAHNFAR